jgi:hypothetical protein
MVFTATVTHACTSDVIFESLNARVQSLEVVLSDCMLNLRRLISATQAAESEIPTECMNLKYYSRLYEEAVSEREEAIGKIAAIEVTEGLSPRTVISISPCEVESACLRRCGKQTAMHRFVVHSMDTKLPVRASLHNRQLPSRIKASYLRSTAPPSSDLIASMTGSPSVAHPAPSVSVVQPASSVQQFTPSVLQPTVVQTRLLQPTPLPESRRNMLINKASISNLFLFARRLAVSARRLALILVVSCMAYAAEFRVECVIVFLLLFFDSFALGMDQSSAAAAKSNFAPLVLLAVAAGTTVAATVGTGKQLFLRS